MPDKKTKEDQQFHLTIVSPDETLFEEDVVRVIAPGVTQDIAILPNHTPLYSQLIKGVVEISLPGGQVEKINIEEGIIRVKLNVVSIIVGF